MLIGSWAKHLKNRITHQNPKNNSLISLSAWFLRRDDVSSGSSTGPQIIFFKANSYENTQKLAWNRFVLSSIAALSWIFSSQNIQHIQVFVNSHSPWIVFIFSRWVILSRWMKLSHSFMMQVFKYLFWSVTLQFAANSPDPCIFFCCHSKRSESVVDYRLMKSIRSPLDKAWLLLCCGGFFVSEHSAHSGLCKLKFSMNSYCFFVFSFIFDAGASSNILVKMNETITAVASLSFMM